MRPMMRGAKCSSRHSKLGGSGIRPWRPNKVCGLDIEIRCTSGTACSRSSRETRNRHEDLEDNVSYNRDSIVERSTTFLDEISRRTLYSWSEYWRIRCLLVVAGRITSDRFPLSPRSARLSNAQFLGCVIIATRRNYIRRISARCSTFADRGQSRRACGLARIRALTIQKL